MEPEAQKNPYGENHPTDQRRDAPEKGEHGREVPLNKERDTGELLEDVREKQIESGETTGGMGREETPSTNAPQGDWQRAERVPRHEELSDDVPS